MDEQLTKEQLEQLKKFQELSPEQQQEILLKQCIFCQIASGNLESFKIYEDSDMVAILDINPASKGHVLLFPKGHFQLLFQLPSELLNKLFKVSSKISMYIVNAVKAKGFNIYIANGTAAGQRVPHFVMHIIPRFDNDNLSFDWQGKPADKKELEKIAFSIRKNFELEKQEKEKVKEAGKQISEQTERELKKFRRRA